MSKKSTLHELCRISKRCHLHGISLHCTVLLYSFTVYVHQIWIWAHSLYAFSLDFPFSSSSYSFWSPLFALSVFSAVAQCFHPPLSPFPPVVSCHHSTAHYLSAQSLSPNCYLSDPSPRQRIPVNSP